MILHIIFGLLSFGISLLICKMQGDEEILSKEVYIGILIGCILFGVVGFIGMLIILLGVYIFNKIDK